MDLFYIISPLVVGRVKNVKFEHDFYINNWFFSAQKGRCVPGRQLTPKITAFDKSK